MPTADVNFLSFSDVDGVVLRGQVVDPAAEGKDPAQFNDILKFSHLTNSIFQDGRVVAGESKENAIDANRLCDNVQVLGYKLSGGRQAAIVVKGGCTRMTFSNVEIDAHPAAWCDVLVDDWSDQAQTPSVVTLTDVRRKDGYPVRVVFGRFSRPHIVGGNCRINWPLTAGLHVYNLVKGLLRKFGVV